jgi:hypothetical protein
VQPDVIAGALPPAANPPIVPGEVGVLAERHEELERPAPVIAGQRLDQNGTRTETPIVQTTAECLEERIGDRGFPKAH